MEPDNAGGDRRLWVLVAAYFVVASVSWLMARRYDLSVPVWPALGIALAALALHGLRAWYLCWFFAADLMAQVCLNWWKTGAMPLLEVGPIVASAACGVAGAVMGAWLLRRRGSRATTLDTPQAVLPLLIAAAAAAAVVATATTALLRQSGSLSAGVLALNWLTGWTSFFVSTAVMGSLVLTWSGPCPGAAFKNRGKEWLALLALLLGVCVVVFGGWPFDTRATPLAFAVLPPMLWAAFRFGMPGTTVVALVVAAAALAGTLEGRGPFATNPVEISFLLVQNYLPAAAVLALVLAPAASRTADIPVRSHSD